MIEIIAVGLTREEKLLEEARDAIQDILVHSDQFSNPQCLSKARAFLRSYDEVKNAAQEFQKRHSTSEDSDQEPFKP